MSTPATLAERQTDLTRQLILDAALDTLERGSVADLTMRAVAKRANLAERTVFRYFASRDEFLDAVAAIFRDRLHLPSPPQTRAELLAAPRALYERFEATANLTKAALHTDLFHRMREAQARDRWAAVRRLVDDLAPRRSERERRIAAANIRYYLAASTWYYFRFYFGFSLEDSIAAAESAIQNSLDGLGRGLKAKA
jgi:AcrR family transcriptional regulator